MNKNIGKFVVPGYSIFVSIVNYSIGTYINFTFYRFFRRIQIETDGIGEQVLIVIFSF
jgi:hypothetical protein